MNATNGSVKFNGRGILAHITSGDKILVPLLSMIPLLATITVVINRLFVIAKSNY